MLWAKKCNNFPWQKQLYNKLYRNLFLMWHVPTLELIFEIPMYKKPQIDAESDQWVAFGLDFEPLLAVQFSQKKAGLWVWSHTGLTPPVPESARQKSRTPTARPTSNGFDFFSAQQMACLFQLCARVRKKTMAFVCAAPHHYSVFTLACKPWCMASTPLRPKFQSKA